MLNLSKICNRILEYSFYLLFFLVPLVMTPFNYELFEFNKMLLVYFLTTIIVASWLIRMVVEKRLIFQRTFWDIPLLIFLISQFLSFFFSIDRHTSFWGYYSRFNGGFASTISYLLLYWAFVSNITGKKWDVGNGKWDIEVRGGNFRSKKSKHQNISPQNPASHFTLLTSLYFMLTSAFLVAGYGIAEHFGVDAKYWVQDVRHRVFSTLGQPNWLAAWLVALTPIPMAMFIGERSNLFEGKKRCPASLIYLGLVIIFYLCLLYTKSRSGLLGFAVAFIIFWSGAFLLYRRHLKTILKPFLIFTFSFLVLSFTVGTPWTPSVGKILSKSPPPPTTPSPPPIMMGGTESGEIRKIVWKGAVDIWRHYPIFGTGVETFAYSYYWYRPREHNDVSEWDFLYNKAHNEYLNYMATTGTVGLLAYLGMIGTFLGWSIRKLGWEVRCESGSRNEKWEKKKTKHSPSLPTSRPTSHFTLLISFLAGFASILVTNFFGFSVVPVNLLFFLFPAMSFVLSSSSPGVGRVSPLRCNRTYTLGIWQWLALAIIIFSLLTTHLSLLKYWYADARFALGEKLNNSGQSTKAFAELQKAIKARPFEPIYHDELGMVAASLAVAAFQQNQSTTAAQLSEFAISQSDQALKISPYNLNFWKNRTRIFYQLSEIEERYNQEALTSLLYAAQLAPTDAKIQYNLGLLYAKVGQEETAVKTLEKTVELKPNYDHARYALALFYEQKKDYQKAKEQLKYIIEKINPNYEPAGEKLKELEKNP